MKEEGGLSIIVAIILIILWRTYATYILIINKDLGLIIGLIQNNGFDTVLVVYSSV